MQSNGKMMIKARAKINLTLDVTGRRPDGYHTVQMVMQSLALHDDVTVSIAPGAAAHGIVLTCSRADLPADEDNLAYRAAALFYEQTKIPLQTCTIDIKKRIPVAAGLAGGSTDAAAVLLAHSRRASRSFIARAPACISKSIAFARGKS